MKRDSFLCQYFEKEIRDSLNLAEEVGRLNFVVHSPLSQTLSPLGWLKVNTDAAFKDGKVGLAVVSRDHTGKVWCLQTKLTKASLA